METATNDERIAPTPPRANFSSQFSRVLLPEPSKLSKRPEILERKMRFFTVRLRNRSGWKIMSSAIFSPGFNSLPSVSILYFQQAVSLRHECLTGGSNGRPASAEQS